MAFLCQVCSKAHVPPFGELRDVRSDDALQVDSRWQIPIWTIALTGVISALLGLINIGSSVAFNVFVSLVVSSFLSSYLIVVLLVIRKKLRKERLNLGPRNLGR